MLQQVLTATEVAKYHRVNPETAYALAKRRDLLSFRVGRSMRFTRQDVEQFVARQAAPGASR
ncbi:helix-turn-helix domain-containing protein [bacterium]|nr:helix-turn-helix domain-containing protein [bacterium]